MSYQGFLGSQSWKDLIVVHVKGGLITDIFIANGRSGGGNAQWLGQQDAYGNVTGQSSTTVLLDTVEVDENAVTNDI